MRPEFQSLRGEECSNVISHEIVMKLVRGRFIKTLPKSFVMRPASRVVMD